MIYNNMGCNQLYAIGNAAMAKGLLERALKIDEKHFGPEHPSTGITLANLGLAYGNLGDY